MYIENVISYYQECYRKEFRDTHVLNYFGSKVEKRLFFSTLETLYQEEEEAYMDQEFAEELYKYLEIHKKEKTILASSFFVTGKLKFLGKQQSICAPLLTTPVTLALSSEGLYYFKYEFKENTINESLLTVIKNNFDLSDDVLVELTNLVNEAHPKDQNIAAIAQKLQAHIPIDISGLDMLPKLVSDKELRKEARALELKVIPAFSVGILEKSKSNRGVLHEIEEIKEGHMYNSLLQHLFSRTQYKPRPSKAQKQPIFVPSNLSEAQTQIIHTSRSSDISVVIGPPGTGKSYTIASLAVDKVYHNQKVLICSKSDQAVDVLYDKIVHDLGVKGLCIRAGASRSYTSKLRKKIEAILHLRQTKPVQDRLDLKRKMLKEVEEILEDLEGEIQKREEKELKHASLFVLRNLSFFKKIQRKFVSKSVLKQMPFWELIEMLKKAVDKKARLVRELITITQVQRVNTLLEKDRQVFKDILKLMTSRSTATKATLLESIDFDVVLQCFPIWITKSTDVGRALPLQKDIFDVVIIDEASQCDITTMIPILVRAKKVIVVGDPKQLRHISFLSKEALETIATDYGVIQGIEVSNYRITSFLDYVLEKTRTQHNIHALDEHYRSVPDIIHYSNRTFYHHNLKVMSDLQLHQKERGLQWIFCGGEKTTKGINVKEVDQLLEAIRKYILSEKEYPAEACTSIGILSPFRDQVDYIKKQLEAFDLAEIKRHKILVGTPFSFQGEERDHMHITFTIDNTTSASVFQYLDREDVFNVSITRAKQKQFLYYSFDPKQFKNTHLLIDYFSESALNSTAIVNRDNEDEFAIEVQEALIEMGVQEDKILVDQELAGYTLDMILTHDQNVFCIDLVGYPGALEHSFSVAHYKTLFRTKISIITIPYAYWKLNKDACTAHLRKKILR